MSKPTQTEMAWDVSSAVDLPGRRGHRGPLKTIASGALAVAVLCVTTACFPPFPGVRAHEPVEPTATPQPSGPARPAVSQETFQPPVIPEGTELGTADLVDRDGAAVMHATIVAGTGTSMRVVTSGGTALPGGDVELVVTPFDLRFGETCADSYVGAAVRDVHPEAASTYPLGSRASTFTIDPSFVSGIALTRPMQGWTPNECLRPLLAIGTITWTLPPLRPDIAAVDSGPAIGAAGETVLRDGILSTYTVRGGDNLRQIAGRFGLTVQDLLFLNPLRESAAGTYTAEKWETFNLENTPQGRARTFPQDGF